MLETNTNNSILCLDDEEGILEAYQNTLSDKSKDKKMDMLIQKRKERSKKNKGENRKYSTLQNINYNLLLARTGEEAVELVRNEVKHGRRIAAGFFDMSLPGIDGLETIQRIRSMDSDILCAIVTAYADYSVERISKIFINQDEWIYFNKPFTSGELKQCAHNLVSSWNRRRREEIYLQSLEKNRKGLLFILEGISKISRVPPLALPPLLKGILEQVIGLVNAENGFLAVFNKNHKLTIKAATGEFNSNFKLYNSRNKQYLSFINSAIMKKKTQTNDTMTVIPLVIAEHVFGVIFIEGKKFFSGSLELLNLFGIQAVNLIQNSRLYVSLEKANIELNLKNKELSSLISKLVETEKSKIKLATLTITDALTKVANRRLLDERLAYEFETAKKYRYPLTCIMLDIDHFKDVNDDYGHMAGDFILVNMANALIGKKRIEDIIVRYGGDEFFMIFPRLDKQNGLLVAERILKEIMKNTFYFEDKEIEITVSLGVCTYENNNMKKPRELINKADKALYKAKSKGRNKVCT